MSVKVAVYDVSEGWTSLVDYFDLNVNASWTNDVNSSFYGSRTTYNTMYVLGCKCAVAPSQGERREITQFPCRKMSCQKFL